LEQFGDVHAVDEAGYVQDALDPLQYPAQLPLPLQDLPAGGVVTATQVPFDGEQVSQDPLHARPP
jgi:hypothetical protein